MISVLITIELGACLARKGIEVVFGGGRFGVMGKMADSLLQNGGKITGIIPKFFTGECVCHMTFT